MRARAIVAIGLCGAAGCGSGEHPAHSPFDARLRAAAFPEGARWRTRTSGPIDFTRCHRQRVSWASTVPFTDDSNALPPHSMIGALPPDGIILAIVQFRDRC